MILGADGNLYGTTATGGTLRQSANGMVMNGGIGRFDGKGNRYGQNKKPNFRNQIRFQIASSDTVAHRSRKGPLARSVSPFGQTWSSGPLE
jgi:hypothetical protein